MHSTPTLPMLAQAGGFHDRFLGPDAPMRGPIVAVGTIIVIYLFYRVSRFMLKRYFRARAHKTENVKNFLLLWRNVWLVTGVVFTVVSLSGSFAALGLSAAFLGMILGWSLQAPVTGIAAWLMIVVKRPFKIGDRVIIAGVIGDVLDINLTHIILDQVGGTIGGEDKSGRGVMIPNAILFQQIIYNYTFSAETILDEVPVLVTYESDPHEAERILIESAREVTAGIIETSGQDPFVRSEFADSGIRMRLRYQADAKDRQRISSLIVCLIAERFAKTSSVEFAYPHIEALHRPKPAPGAPVESKEEKQ